MICLKRLLELYGLTLTVCFLVLVPSCGTDDGSGPRQETVIIDNQGGTLALGDARVTIPPNALEGEQELIMTEGAKPPAGIPEEYEQASEFYTLEPHGIVFDSQVTIRLPYRTVQDPLDLLRLDDDSDTTWDPVPDVTFSDGEATFQTDHFCHLVIGGRKKCKDKDGDGFGIACDSGWDCDDDNADVNPDASEGPSDTCSNGLDDDCDGLTDDADTGCTGCTTDVECDDDNACTSDTCVAKECSHTNFPDGLQCNDADPCTVGDVCLSGTCQGEQKDCSGLDGPCAVGVCDPATGECGPVHKTDGIICDDGMWCTINDACESGSCTLRDPRDCNDADICTQDVCNEDLDRCEHPMSPNPGAEGPSDTCQNALDDDCDGLTDQDDPDCAICVSDGDCDDGMYCTDPDTCAGGVCTQVARDCSQLGDDCNVGVCNEMANQCEALPQADGTTCDDGLWCTINDACESGSCTLRDPRDCDDGNVCTSDSCDEAGDQCNHMLVPNPGAEGPSGDPTCSNGVDDDCDGLTDTDDPDC